MKLHRRGLLGGGAASLGSLALPRPARARPGIPIALWGDSLTFGTGADTVAGKYPNRLGGLFMPPRQVFNGGVGGETSSQVAARMLTDDAHRDWIAVIWAGRNNYRSCDTVLADIDAMTTHLRSGRFLVLSIPTAALAPEFSGAPEFEAIMTLDTALRDRFAVRFVDIRAVLIAEGLARLGPTPIAQDLVDIGHGVPPSGMRADHVHLNDSGQAVVAQTVHDAVLRQGW